MIEEIKKYFREILKFSERTIDFYLYDIRQFSDFCIFFDKSIFDANSQDIQNFIDCLKDEFSNTTIMRKITSLCAFFNWAFFSKKIKSNPILSIKRNSIKTNIKIPPKKLLKRQSLSNLEILKLIELIDSEKSKKKLRDKILFQLIIFRGVSANEIIHIKKKNISFEDNTIIIHRIKNEKVSNVCYKIEVNFLIKDIKKYLNESKPNELLFPNRQGELMTSRAVRKQLKKYEKILGIHLDPRSLRYSFASHRMKFDSLATISSRLGHKNKTITRTFFRGQYEDLRS